MLVSRSNYIQPLSCAPVYFACQAGYYLDFASTGVVDCLACNATYPSLAVFVSQGLTTNDPTSCLWDCNQQLATYNSGACKSRNRLQTPTNPPGMYGINASLQQCPLGYTSQQANALVIADCLKCTNVPATANALQSATCDFTCASGTKRGSRCVLPVNCPSSTQGVSESTGTCAYTTLPWQPSGQAKAGISWLTTPGNPRPPPAPPIQLKQPICSSATDGRYVYIAYCNQPFLAFVNLSAPTNARLLIGNSTPGYQEGFKTVALFQTNLSIAMDPLDNTRIYTLDTLNEVLREILIDYPGSYLTKSYLLYGEPGYGYRADSLLNPTSIRPVRPAYLVFQDDTGIWQLHAPTGDVTPVIQQPQQPSSNYTLSPDGLTLTIKYTNNATLVITAVGSQCPSQSTSTPGSDCAIACGSHEYVDTLTGACRDCGNPTCAPGYYLQACKNSTPATCSACPPLANTLAYKRVYTSAATDPSCQHASWAWVPTCPRNYFQASLAATICSQCPTYATTLLPGATSIEQCRCPANFKLENGYCNITTIYPVPARSACAFGYYNKGSQAACVSCRDEPCPQCVTGQYATSNCTCEPCYAQENAHFTAAGSLNNPSSCPSECNTGFYLQSASILTPAACLACTNLPGANWIYLTNGVQDLQASCQIACAPGYSVLYANCVQD